MTPERKTPAESSSSQAARVEASASQSTRTKVSAPVAGHSRNGSGSGPSPGPDGDDGSVMNMEANIAILKKKMAEVAEERYQRLVTMASIGNLLHDARALDLSDEISPDLYSAQKPHLRDMSPTILLAELEHDFRSGMEGLEKRHDRFVKLLKEINAYHNPASGEVLCPTFKCREFEVRFSSEVTKTFNIQNKLAGSYSIFMKLIPALEKMGMSISATPTPRACPQAAGSSTSSGDR